MVEASMRPGQLRKIIHHVGRSIATDIREQNDAWQCLCENGLRENRGEQTVAPLAL